MKAYWTWLRACQRLEGKRESNFEEAVKLARGGEGGTEVAYAPDLKRKEGFESLLEGLEGLEKRCCL